MFHAWSATRFALCLVVAVAATGAISCAPDETAREKIKDTMQAAQTCVTVQRGTLGAVTDAMVRSDQPTSNGNSTSLTTNASSPVRHGYVRWDLSSIPSNAVVSSAIASMRVNLGSGAGINAHQVTSSWGETTVTWATAPSALSAVAGALSSAGAGANATVDLTALASTWVANAASNQGILLERDATAGQTVLASSEDATVALRPALQVCYSIPSGATCSDGIQNQGETGVDCGGPCAACASCSDGVKNQGETGVDCGGPCPACPSCSDGIKNQGETGVDCGGPCAACASCSDGIQNQGETGIDCGGPCAACASCSDGIQNQGETGVDCGGPCAACASCSDGIKNQGETGIDCGGPCAACASCSDGIKNQGETGVDCGGPCAACASCSDGIKNQGETGVDCGGPCPACSATCSDGIQNQGETGVDCGGPCPSCTPVCVTVRRGTAGAVIDAMVRSDQTTANANGTSMTANSPAPTRHSYVRWDLSAIPAGATVTSAIASLRVNLGDGAAVVNAHQVTSSWGETTVTWATAPSALPGAAGTLSGAGSGATATVSLTALAGAWVSGAAANHGVMLERDAASGQTVFASSEDATVNNRPSLQVCYVLASTPTCSDGIQNQGETGVDCGGPCPACAATCSDGIQNQGETGVDCGGPCPACAATCSDGIKNQGETGIDCGGPCPACAATCSDGIKNQGETGIDCGGPCPACAATCSDGIQNQSETGVDCGGPCPACAPTCSDGIQNQGETGIDCGSPCGACPALVRGPYQQMLTASSVILVWTTTVGSSSEVHYGTSPSNLNQAVNLPASVTQHEVTVLGLQPDTRYYYSVGSSHGVIAGGTAAHYFQTAPPIGSPKKFRAWVVGDSGTGDGTQAAVTNAMLGWAGAYRPNLFLHMGDIAYNSGTNPEFTSNFFAPYASILQNTVVWPTLGNHEGINSSSSTQTGPYYAAYVLPKAAEAGGLASGTEAYYSFDYANVHFVVLNSQDVPRTPGGAMLTWLAADLAATNQDWIIAYWHHPAYTKGSHDSDTEGELVEMRQYALPVLEAGGVDLVLAGHSHIYERSYLLDGAYATPTTAAGHIKDSGDGKLLGSGPYRKLDGNNAHDGAVYVTAGHGGAGVGQIGVHPVMYFTEAQNGSCVLDIDENRLSLANIRRDGVVSDRFSMIKGNGLFVAQPDGGEALSTGSSYTIRWSTAGSIPNVTLTYSVDDGATWLPIAQNIPNTGSYAWTVPSATTSKALVRVTNAANASVKDESNAGFTISSTVTYNAVTFGSVWKYHDQGVDLGTSWRALAFNDASWAQGPAQLGYGDGDEATVLFHPANAYPSVYFRKVVNLSGPVIAASLQVLHDDGVAVWVNGVQVFSKYTGNGTGYSAFASATSAENELSSGTITLTPNPFVVGNNIIAVMVKQASASSSDISFDLQLNVTTQ